MPLQSLCTFHFYASNIFFIAHWRFVLEPVGHSLQRENFFHGSGGSVSDRLRSNTYSTVEQENNKQFSHTTWSADEIHECKALTCEGVFIPLSVRNVRMQVIVVGWTDLNRGVTEHTSRWGCYDSFLRGRVWALTHTERLKGSMSGMSTNRPGRNVRSHHMTPPSGFVTSTSWITAAAIVTARHVISCHVVALLVAHLDMETTGDLLWNTVHFHIWLAFGWQYSHYTRNSMAVRCKVQKTGRCQCAKASNEQNVSVVASWLHDNFQWLASFILKQKVWMFPRCTGDALEIPETTLFKQREYECPAQLTASSKPQEEAPTTGITDYMLPEVH